MAAEHVERKLTTILAADVAGYSRLMADDEEATLRTLTEYSAVIKDLATELGGRVFSAAGDERLAEFPSTVEAVRCASRIQNELAARNAGLPENRRMLFRIGINLGDVMVEGSDLLGDGVNVAARLESLADPGGICVSGAVYEQVHGKLDLGYQNLGPRQFKNIAEPVTVYRVTAEGGAATAANVRTRPRLRIVLAVAAAAVVAIAAIWLPQMDRGGPGTTRTAEPSIAVMPFINMSDDPANEYFSDGISEELLNELAQVPGLRVAARTSSFAFKGKNVDVSEIGEKLNVNAILEGSVRRAGNRIRITAQLISTADGFHMWSQSYDRELDDIFAIQDEISTSIVAALKIELLDEEEPAPRRTAANVDAYDLYLLGRHQLNKRTKASLEHAADFYRQATAMDPNYALAHAGLADTYALLADTDSTYGDIPLEEASRLAEQAIGKALALDDRLAEAYAARGLLEMLKDNNGRAAEILSKAIALNPNYAPAYSWYANVLGDLGRRAEQATALERAVELDPMSTVSNANYGTMLLQSGKLAEARRIFERVVEFSPEFGFAYAGLGASRWLEGDLVEASRLFARAAELRPDSDDMSDALGFIHLDLRDFEVAARYLKDSAALADIVRGDFGQAIARVNKEVAEKPEDLDVLTRAGMIHALAGEFGEARKLLENVSASPGVDKSDFYDDDGFVFSGVRTVSTLVRLRFLAGDEEAARALGEQSLDRLLEQEKKGFAGSGFEHARAEALAALGRDEEALAALEKAFDMGWRRAWVLEHDIVYGDLRADPRFQEILEKILQDVQRMRRDLAEPGT